METGLADPFEPSSLKVWTNHGSEKSGQTMERVNTTRSKSAQAEMFAHHDLLRRPIADPGRPD
jgi:hypothetical protein